MNKTQPIDTEVIIKLWKQIDSSLAGTIIFEVALDNYMSDCLGVSFDEKDFAAFTILYGDRP